MSDRAEELLKQYQESLANRSEEQKEEAREFQAFRDWVAKDMARKRLEEAERLKAFAKWAKEDKARRKNQR
jgi:predicted metal-binding transcription factor (methanogenesis marker protein 9)